MEVDTSLTPGLYSAIAQEASRHHLPLVGHIPATVSAWDIVKADQTDVEHLGGRYLNVRISCSRDEAYFNHVIGQTLDNDHGRRSVVARTCRLGPWLSIAKLPRTKKYMTRMKDGFSRNLELISDHGFSRATTPKPADLEAQVRATPLFLQDKDPLLASRTRRGVSSRTTPPLPCGADR